MRAAVFRRFGSPEVVSVVDVPKPTPRRDEILVKFHASTVSAADYRARSRNDLSGVVDAHRFADTGRKRGNVVVRVAASPWLRVTAIGSCIQSLLRREEN